MAKKKVSLVRSLAMKKSWAERRKSPMREQARKRASQPKPKGEPRFYILWMPASHKPPRVTFGTLEGVQRVADIMVNKYRSPIYVMQSVELHTLGTPEVIPYAGKQAKELKAKPCPPETFHVSAHSPHVFQLKSCPPPLSRQGQPWDQEQDDYLTQLWHSYSKDFRILGERMGRSELAIEYRLEALGLRPREDR